MFWNNIVSEWNRIWDEHLTLLFYFNSQERQQAHYLEEQKQKKRKVDNLRIGPSVQSGEGGIQTEQRLEEVKKQDLTLILFWFTDPESLNKLVFIFFLSN